MVINGAGECEVDVEEERILEVRDWRRWRGKEKDRHGKGRKRRE